MIPAAARERRAAALGASLRRAGGGVRQLPALSELRGALGPDAWASVAADLDWVAPPPAVAATRARRGLTLTDLRRFLECPLQASARVLLPVGDDDDALAEAESAIREHEPLDEARAATIPFLRDVLTGLLAGPREAATTSSSPKRTIERPPSRRSRGRSPTASSAARCASVTSASSAAGATASCRRPAAS